MMKQKRILLFALLTVLLLTLVACQNIGSPMPAETHLAETELVTAAVTQSTHEEVTKNEASTFFDETKDEMQTSAPESQTEEQTLEEITEAHVHATAQWTLDKERSDCMSVLVYVGTCYGCGEPMEKSEEGLGQHALVFGDGGTQVEGCQRIPVINISCDNCSYTEQSTGEVTYEHDFSGEYVLQGEYDCTQDAISVCVCQYCDATDQRIEPAKDSHTWRDWQWYKSSTCIKEGEEIRYCQYCSAHDTQPIPIDSNAHDFGDQKVQVITPPYCDQFGEGYRHCLWCQQDIPEAIWPTYQHTMTETYTYHDVYNHKRSCPCGEKYEVVEHTVNENNVCTGCTHDFGLGSVGLEYTLITEENLKEYYAVTGIGTCKDTDLVIPAYYLGKPVVSVASRALQNSDIETLYIPCTVHDLGNYAFANCRKLRKVTIQETDRLNCGEAFDSCRSLRTVDYEGDMTSYLRGVDGRLLINGTDLYVDGQRVTGIDMTNMEETGFHDQLQGCTSLETLILHPNATVVGYLHGCTSLKTLYIPAGVTDVYGLANCTSLETLTFEKGSMLTNLPVMTGCSSLQSIQIPAQVTTLWAFTFSDCTSLEFVTFEEGSQLTYIDGYAFSNCHSLKNITIPDGVGELGVNVFENCTSLQAVALGSGITTIPEKAFYGCTSLAVVQGMEQLSAIGREAFRGCASLKSFHVSDKIQVIDVMTFYECTGLESIYLGSGLTAIDGGAFEYCEALTYVNFGGTMADWLRITVAESPDYVVAFPTYYAENLYIQGELVTEVIIPDGITTIPNGLFMNCTAIERVVIPDSVRTVSENAFIYCSNLTYVTLGAQVEHIAKAAFFGCDKLTTIYNRSNLSLTAGGEDYGFVATNALCISAEPIDDDGMIRIDGFVFAFDGEGYILVDYTGTDREITLPDNINGATYVIGKSAFAYHKTLEKITISSGVTAILDKAFYQANNLTEVVFEEGVTSIGEYAFYQTNLKKVLFPDSLVSLYAYAFQENTQLTRVHFGKNFADPWTMAFALCPLEDLSVSAENEDFVVDGDALIYLPKYRLIYGTYKTEIPFYVTSIAQAAFAHCYGLEYIEIPDSVTEIKDQAFWDCKDLVSVTLPEGLTQISDYCFAFCTSLCDINMPESIETVGQYTFYQCEKLSQVTFGDDLQSIGMYAFYQCKNLQTVTFGKGLSLIRSGAFCECESLQSVRILAPVCSISNSAFQDCISLQFVVFEGDLDYMGDDMFSGCTALESVIFKGQIMNLGSYVFEGCSSLRTIDLSTMLSTELKTGFFQECTSLTQVILPSTLTEISYSAFFGCISLEQVVLPEGLEHIGSQAFHGCENLGEIQLPTTLKTIGSYAFANTNLREIVIPQSVEEIGHAAFECQSLTKVVLKSGTATISGYAFSTQFLRELYLPADLVALGDSVLYAYDGEVYKIDIYYEGTAEDLAAVIIGENNQLLDCATWHYQYQMAD